MSVLSFTWDTAIDFMPYPYPKIKPINVNPFLFNRTVFAFFYSL